MTSEKKVIHTVFDKDSTVYNNGQSGECYFTALVISMRHAKEVDGLTICHGVCVNSLDEKPMMHAWVEFPVELEAIGSTLWMCVDAAQPDKDVVVIPRELYYMVGRIDPELIRRYTPKEALDLSIKTGHCGLWHAPLTDMTEYEGEMKVDAEGLIIGDADEPDITKEERQKLIDLAKEKVGYEQ